MSRKVLSRAERAGQANYFELIPMVRMESQHSIGAPAVMTFQDLQSFPRNRGLKSEIVDDDHGCFGKTDPLRANFQKKNNYSERIHRLIEPRLMCKFREIWLTGNRQSRALFT